MTQIPAHILAQVHRLAAEGVPVERITFLTRLSRDAVEDELANPTVSVPSVTTTKEGTSADE